MDGIESSGRMEVGTRVRPTYNYQAMCGSYLSWLNKKGEA